ncbi:MAG: NUDIX domain-containing protein [Bacteroidales bacterium]
METKKEFCYDYPRPAVTTDCVIFGFDETDLKVLLIQRGIEPYKGKWAFPGGFLHMDETVEDGAKRELFEETGLKDIFIEQLYTFSDVDRDPRGRVITVAYYALVNLNENIPVAGDDAKKAAWFPVSKIPSLAFDHDQLLRMALYRLKGKIRYQPIGFELLPEKFTLPDLQHLYEVILETSLDRRNFRKKIQKMDLLIELEEKQQGVAHKAATYFKFDKKKYEQLAMKGFNFEI